MLSSVGTPDGSVLPIDWPDLRKWLAGVWPRSPGAERSSSKRQHSLSPIAQTKRQKVDLSLQTMVFPTLVDSMSTHQDEFSAHGMLLTPVVASPKKNRRDHSSRGSAQGTLLLRHLAACSAINSTSSLSETHRMILPSVDAEIKAIRGVQPSDSISNTASNKRSRSQSKSRATSLTKPKPTTAQLLMQSLTPPVTYCTLREWLFGEGASGLPPAAAELRLQIDIAAHETAFVPSSLQEFFEAWLEPMGSIHRSKATMYYGSVQMSLADYMLWITMEDIIRATLKTREQSDSELTGFTVNRILSLVVSRRDQFANAPHIKSKELIHHLDM